MRLQKVLINFQLGSESIRGRSIIVNQGLHEPREHRGKLENRRRSATEYTWQMSWRCAKGKRGLIKKISTLSRKALGTGFDLLGHTYQKMGTCLKGFKKE